MSTSKNIYITVVSMFVFIAVLLGIKRQKTMLESDYDDPETTGDFQGVPAFCPIWFKDSKPSTINFKFSEMSDSGDRAEPPQAVWGNIQELFNNLQALRNELNRRLGTRVTIVINHNGGYRSVSQNGNSGGASQSQHMCGKAADFVVFRNGVPVDLDFVNDVIIELMNNGSMKKGGLKRYSTFIHYDTRGVFVTWRVGNGGLLAEKIPE